MQTLFCFTVYLFNFDESQAYLYFAEDQLLVPWIQWGAEESHADRFARDVRAAADAPAVSEHGAESSQGMSFQL